MYTEQIQASLVQPDINRVWRLVVSFTPFYIDELRGQGVSVLEWKENCSTIEQDKNNKKCGERDCIGVSFSHVLTLVGKK